MKGIKWRMGAGWTEKIRPPWKSIHLLHLWAKMREDFLLATLFYVLPWFGVKLGLMKPFSNEDVGIKSDSLCHLISSSFSIWQQAGGRGWLKCLEWEWNATTPSADHAPSFNVTLGRCLNDPGSSHNKRSVFDWMGNGQREKASLTMGFWVGNSELVLPHLCQGSVFNRCVTFGKKNVPEILFLDLFSWIPINSWVY